MTKKVPMIANPVPFQYRVRFKTRVTAIEQMADKEAWHMIKTSDFNNVKAFRNQVDKTLFRILL
jgi:hypothetical protein